MAKKEVEVVEKKTEETSENKVEEVIEKKSLAKKIITFQKEQKIISGKLNLLMVKKLLNYLTLN